MKNQALLVGLSAMSFLLPTTAIASTFSGIYVFGDSLSDTGNFYQQSQQHDLSSDPPPFPADPGSPYPAYPGFPYFQGRFSNGPIWVEILNQSLGLSPSSLHGFASGGASTGTFHRGGTVFPGTTTQITSYLGQSGGTLDPNALYILSAGSNDYGDPSFSNPADIPVAAVTNTATALGTLRAAGAKNFVVVGIPDLGEVPVNSGLPAPVRSQLSALSSAHNGALAALIPGLENTLNANITFLDIGTLLTSVINNPSQYGLTNVTDGCLLVPSCANDPNEQNKYLFWDTAHPTTFAHQEIARLALTQLQNNTPVHVPEADMAFGVVAFGIAGWVQSWRKNTKRDATISGSVGNSNPTTLEMDS